MVPDPQDTRGAALLRPAADYVVDGAGPRVVDDTQARAWEGVKRTRSSRVEELHTCGTAELASGLILVLGTSRPGTCLKLTKRFGRKTPCQRHAARA